MYFKSKKTIILNIYVKGSG